MNNIFFVAVAGIRGLGFQAGRNFVEFLAGENLETTGRRWQYPGKRFSLRNLMRGLSQAPCTGPKGRRCRKQ
jgi:hypothetical protein